MAYKGWDRYKDFKSFLRGLRDFEVSGVII